jgi:hypothetical protein
VRRPFAIAGVALALSFCKKAPTGMGADGGIDAPGEAATSAPIDAAAALAPPRCQLTADAPDVSSSILGESVEFGGAATTKGTALVGVIRTAGGRRVASIVRMGKAVNVIDLGVAMGDEPAPVPIVRDDDSLAAAYAKRDGQDAGSRPAGGSRTRELSVFRLTGGAAEWLVSVPQQSDESPAFDVAVEGPPPGRTQEEAGGGSPRLLLAWDESAAPPRGIVKVAALSSDLRAAETLTVASPDTSDADTPSLAPRPGGFWLVWIAHKPQPTPDAGTDAATVPELEGPGEARAFQWLELAALDRDGKTVGAIRRLTSATGHASAYTLAAHDTRLDVLARDDNEASDGAGGRLLRVTVEGEHVDGPVVLVPDGVGRGEPGWLAAADGAFLSYVDMADHARLVPFTPSATVRGLSSVEPALEEARPLVFTGAVLLAAAPADDRHLLRTLTCTP